MIGGVGNTSPYTVSVQDTQGLWRTPAVTEVSFTRSENGNTSATFTMADTQPFLGLGPDCRVIISNQWGAVLWTGSVGIPGQEFKGRLSQPTQIGCTGNLSRLSMRSYSFPYVVTRMDAWEKDNMYPSKPDGVVEVGTRPDAADVPALSFQFVQSEIVSGDRLRMRFTTFEQDPDWKVGGVALTTKSGTSDSRWTARGYVDAAGWDHRVFNQNPPSKNPVRQSAVMDGTTDRPRGQTLLSVEWRYDYKEGVMLKSDIYWTSAYAISVVAERYNRIGAFVTPTSATGIYTNQVVEDLMGRTGALREVVNITGSSVQGGTVEIKSLDYSLGPVTIAQLLDDLVTAEGGDWYWAWGHEGADGRSALVFGQRSTEVRYVIPAVQGVQISGSGSGDTSLCDRVVVRWVGLNGLATRKTYIADRVKYPELTRLPTSGRYYADVDLGKTTSDQATIDRIGMGILDQVARRPDDAMVSISPDVRVIDKRSGRVISADLIGPSSLVYLAATGSSVRVQQVESTDGAVKLTLGSSRKTAEQVIDDARKRRSKR